MDQDTHAVFDAIEFADKLDPEAYRLFLQLAPALVLTRKPTSSVAAWRRNWQLCVKAFATREEVKSVEDGKVGANDRDIPIRVYTPDGLEHENERPVLLWIHGGGFVAGDLYTAGATARRLANSCQCVVVTVSYRLAPEHPMSAGLEDCLDVYDWLCAKGDVLGLDPTRIAVGGDSAGGALAALVAQRRSGPDSHRPLAQLLVYPAIDLDAGFEDLENRTALQRVFVSLFHWLQNEVEQSGLHDPSLSPSSADNLAALPPTIIVTAGCDPLLADARSYARRLAIQGVAVRAWHFPGQFHGFMSFDRVLGGANAAFQGVSSQMQALFSGSQCETAPDVRVLDWPRFSFWMWLRPGQRLKETAVTCAMLRDTFLGRPSPRHRTQARPSA